MKNRILCVLFSIAVGLLGTARLAANDPLVQPFMFDISIDGYTNLVGTSAAGEVTFTLPSVWAEVLNNSSYDSRITEFYILKPLTSEGRRLNALTGAGDFYTDPATTHWSVTNQLQNDTTNILKLNKNYYFGATLHPPGSSQGISSGDTLSFSFTLQGLNPGETIDWDAYLSRDFPHVVVRWQSVNGEDSAAGYGYFTPVPEPRLIGALGVLAMGGLLVARRRLTKKA